MATSSPDDNGPPSPPPFPASTVHPPVQETDMLTEDDEKRFTFNVKIQFAAKSIETATDDNNPIANGLKKLLSKMKTIHPDTRFKTASNIDTQLSDFPMAKTALESQFQYTINSKARRNITVVMSFETSHLWRQFKTPAFLKWLQKENYWFERHLFKTTEINITTIGWLSGKHPNTTHRPTLDVFLKTEIDSFFLDKSAAERQEYYQRFDHTHDTSDRASPEVRVCFHKPSWTIRSQRFDTQAIGIQCVSSERSMVMDLLTHVFPSTGKVAFIPNRIPHDLALLNPQQKYADIIQAQNAYLQEHVSFPIGGISESDMYFCDETQSIETSLLSQPFFSAVEKTNQTQRTGKWLLETTRADASRAIQFIDQNIRSMVDHLADPTTFAINPYPRRLARSSVPTSYTNTVAQSATTITSSEQHHSVKLRSEMSETTPIFPDDGRTINLRETTPISPDDGSAINPEMPRNQKTSRCLHVKICLQVAIFAILLVIAGLLLRLNLVGKRQESLLKAMSALRTPPTPPNPSPSPPLVHSPTPFPTRAPVTARPTLPPQPTKPPTLRPTLAPTTSPTISPTQQPTANPWQLVTRGNGNLLGVFPTPDGLILVVDSLTVRRIANNSTVVASYSSPREITAAVSDGTYVAIADRATLVSLSASTLQVQTSQNLKETCASGVMLPNHQFVCGPENDWDRVFTVYDLVAGAQSFTSQKYTYNGIPMKRVPGQPAFLTVTTGSSPTDIKLYNAINGKVIFVTDSPYHGDFPISNVYAFWGNPASHVITNQGIMLRIFGPDNKYCVRGTCLKRDGELGILARSERYGQMTQDADGGRIYGLLNNGNDQYSSSRLACNKGCVLHEVDVAARALNRTVDAPQAYETTLLAHDPADDSVLLGGKLENEEKYEVRRMVW